MAYGYCSGTPTMGEPVKIYKELESVLVNHTGGPLSRVEFDGEWIFIPAPKFYDDYYTGAGRGVYDSNESRDWYDLWAIVVPQAVEAIGDIRLTAYCETGALAKIDQGHGGAIVVSLPNDVPDGTYIVSLNLSDRAGLGIGRRCRAWRRDNGTRAPSIMVHKGSGTTLTMDQPCGPWVPPWEVLYQALP